MPRLAVLTLLVLTSAAVGMQPAAADAPSVQHCVVHVVAQRADGELVTDQPRCYATDREAMAEGRRSSGDRAMSAQATFALATHYTGTGFQGTSTTIFGSNCNGGYINTSQFWEQNIESTRNYSCGAVSHYLGANLTGGTPWTTYLPYGGDLPSSPAYRHHIRSIQYS